MAVYLLHYTKPLHRGGTEGVRHYLGWCREDRLVARLREHARGQSGSALPREFFRQGIPFVLVAWWPDGTPSLESYIKSRGHLGSRCPICTPKPVPVQSRQMKEPAPVVMRQDVTPSDEPMRTSGGASWPGNQIDSITLSHRVPLPVSDTWSPGLSGRPTRTTGGIGGSVVARHGTPGGRSAGTRQRSPSG